MKTNRKKVLVALSAPRRARGAQRKRVLIALSGGIDSAVSAYLLIKQGYEVEAAFMKNWSSMEGLLKNECPWLEDRQDALRVAAFLRIPLHSLDFEKQYQERVMKYFFEEYKKGRTPNPDVMCNKEIKFKLLYGWAMRHGFDYLATGHYARIVKSQKLKVKSRDSNFLLSTFNFQLVRSADEFKDQTYFIYNIKPSQLPHLMFPIGGMKKTAVRALAKKIGLPNADKKESMGLCFVGKIRLKDFLEQKLKERPGDIIDVTSASSDGVRQRGVSRLASDGKRPQADKRLPIRAAPTNNDSREAKTIGQHRGLHNYTIGQRQGIRVGATGPYYVVAKDLKHNRLYVTNNPDDPALWTSEIQIHSVNWLVSNVKRQMSNVVGRYRHQGDRVPLTIRKIKTDLYSIIFKHPQKALASGQSLVLYDGKICVGGGVIV